MLVGHFLYTFLLLPLPSSLSPSGPLLVAKDGDTVLASHSIPAPSKLSEFWVQLYSHVATLECCENFVSAHPPSAPCLLCHPFGMWATQQLTPPCTQAYFRIVCMHVYTTVYGCFFRFHFIMLYVCIVGLNPTQGSSFLCKSDCLGCVVLLCFVVCMTLLASSFLPSASLINMHCHCVVRLYMYVSLQKTLLRVWRSRSQLRKSTLPSPSPLSPPSTPPPTSLPTYTHTHTPPLRLKYRFCNLVRPV